jgi:hypothetical protein
MSNNLTDMLQSEDIGRLIEYSEGHRVTLAWIAACWGSSKIVTLLVARGASVDFGVRGISVRVLGMLKPTIMKAIAAGGASLTAFELCLLLTSSMPSDLPTDDEYDLIHEAAQFTIGTG